MLEFMKGDSKNLEGRVLVYVANAKPCCNQHTYIALYSTTSKFDIKDIPFKELPKSLKSKDLSQNREVDLFAMFSRPLSFESLEETAQIEGDIIDAGRVVLAMAPPVLEGVTTAYLFNYMTQLEMRLKVSNEDIEGFDDSFRNYATGEKLSKRLYQLVGPLLDAIKHKDDKSERKAIAYLRHFMKGSSYFPEMVDMVGIAQTKLKNKSDIIAAYIDKWAAIQDEDFEKAQRIKAKLNAFFKGHKQC